MSSNILFRTASILFLIALSCKSPHHQIKNMDVQGHRGCRGLMPENTIEAFIHAIELGVTTLEMDVIMSGDSQMIVSHEPFFNHEISSNPDSTLITPENDKKYNLYKMSTAEIQKWDVGLKDHPRFPLQSKLKAIKPTLLAVIDTVENYLKLHSLPPVFYNIEIKFHPDFVGNYFPDAATLVDKTYETVTQAGIVSRTCIQSFDTLCLNLMYNKNPKLVLAYLIENKSDIDENLKKLHFKPTIYSPDYVLVDEKLVKKCRDLGIKIIPWTVNEVKDITAMVDLGVDGIISDFPDRVIEIKESYSAN